MDLLSKEEIQKIFKKYGFRPSKKLGQNFLINKSVIKKLVQSASLTKEDTVLEVGAGTGNITKELSKKAKRVIAVEKSPVLCRILKENLKDCKNIKIIQKDILNLGISDLKIKNYKVIANLPHSVASLIIRMFLEDIKTKPKEMVLMLQKEVGERICAQPPNMNLLAVSVQFYGKAKIISFVSRNCFWPKPKVDSVIIKITPFKPSYKYSSYFQQNFFKIVKIGFSQPRKQIINNFSKKIKIEKEKIKEMLLKNNIKPSQRAETLSVKDWVSLSKNFDVK